MRFDGQTALVTGAARGIGLAITERLLAEGARVALVDRAPEVEAVAERPGPAARGLVADVTVPPRSTAPSPRPTPGPAASTWSSTTPASPGARTRSGS